MKLSALPASWLRMTALAGLVAVGLSLVTEVAQAVDPKYRNQVRTARQLLSRGQYEQAARIYKEALDAHPADEQASVGYAGALIGMEQYEEAKQFLDQALLVVEPKANLYRKREEANRRLGNSTEAFGDALQVMAENDGLAPWVFRETRELLAEGLDAGKARKTAEKALADNPDNSYFVILTGVILAIGERPDEAVTLVSRYDGEKRRGGQTLLQFADELLGLGERPLGMRVLEEAAEKADKPSHRSDMLFRLASLLEEDGRYEDALARYQRITEEREGTSASGKALLAMAEIHQRHLDDPRGALAVYNRLRNDPTVGRYRPVMFLQMGDCYVRLGDFENAAAAYRDVIPEAIDPEHAEASAYKLAEVEFYRGDPDSALSLYQTMAETYSRSLLTDNAADRYILLNTYSSLGGGDALATFGRMDWGRAVGDSAVVDSTAMLLIEQYPGGELAAEAWMALADLALNHDQPELALTRLDEVVTNHAGDRRAPRALRRQGDILLNSLDRPEEALARYERILTDYSDSVLAGEVRRQVEALRRAIKS